jgi:hypothetical protein
MSMAPILSPVVLRQLYRKADDSSGHQQASVDAWSAPPFWERQRGDGPITRVIERRKRDEERFEQQRLRMRHPDKYVVASGHQSGKGRP